METEIKLEVNSKDKLFSIINENWFNSLCHSNNPDSVAVLNNTYYDTSDFALRNKRGSLRTRVITKDNKIEYEHTVKYGSKCDNGLYQRYEWNLNAANDIIDIDFFIRQIENDSNQADSITVLKKLFDNINYDNLRGFCSTIVERTVYIIIYDSSKIEVSLDYGKAIAAGKSSVICELELELLDGNIDDLLKVAKIFEDNTDFTPSNESKFKKCLNLIGWVD